MYMITVRTGVSVEKMARKAVLLTVLGVTLLSAQATTPSALDYESRLIDALIIVESSGNDRAIGDPHMKDRAYGPLQIRQPCVDDANEILGTSYTAEQMLGNRPLSVLVCRTYLRRYANRKTLGREPTLEDMARIWNGGPSGWKKQSTIQYWSKVNAALATGKAPTTSKPKLVLKTTKRKKVR